MDVTPTPPLPLPRARGLMLPAMALMLGYIGVEGPRLWGEYRHLRGEWERDVSGRVIGYPGIAPRYSLARGPADWLREEGDDAYLWAGWDRKRGRHNWFKVGRGQLARERLSHPTGRDSIRAIDRPRAETRGGEIWANIPPENTVATGEFLGVALAYPVGILEKVLVVNDAVHTKPILVVYTPFVADVHAAELFNATLDGKRLVMGHSGYLWDGRPLLYDREGETLWVPAREGLKAVAGPRKGRVLGRIARLDPAPWGEWSAAHPDGRLLAGAIRDDLRNQKP